MTTKITKQQVADRIQKAENILIVTHRKPRIDHLTACIGLNEILENLDKNVVFVYENDIPDNINFLKPEEIIQQNAESLRDFIISFAKTKVDKFRYTLDGDQYNILLTPAHRQVIHQDDISYHTGDFNVDLILGVGLIDKSSFCPSVSQHEQLIHGAPLVNLLYGAKEAELELECWHESSVCGLSEMVYELVKALEVSQPSQRVIHALLTGIIDQTERYKNQQTQARTMHISGELIELGADLPTITANLGDQYSVLEPVVKEEPAVAAQHDTQAIQPEAKKAVSRRPKKQHYMPVGHINPGEVQIGSATTQTKSVANQHRPEQVTIDAEGNLQISEGEVVDEVAQAQTASADASTPPTISHKIGSSKPGSHDAKMTPPPVNAMQSPAGAVSAPTTEAKMPNAATKMASMPAPAAAPAMPAPTSSNDFVSSLASMPNQAASPPPAPAAAPQASTLDSYLSQNNAAPNVPASPDKAPPINAFGLPGAAPAPGQNQMPLPPNALDDLPKVNQAGDVATKTPPVPSTNP